jgi:penicillin-binding protein A
MAGRVASLGRVFVGLLAVLLVYLAAVQVVWGPEIAEAPQNPRLTLAAQQIHWGRILDRHLAVLADSAEVDGRQVRRYADGTLFAHLLGYRSQRYGLAGIELQDDPALLGLPVRDPWRALQQAFGQAGRGNDLVLTVDTAVQQAASQALGDRRGAVVALDPRTGAVLALVSHPSFDPAMIEARWPAVAHDPSAPLLDRATQGEYPPGSAFKPIVLAAALARGRVTQQTEFDCPGSITVAGTTITDFNGESHGRVTLAQAFALSCNVTFVRVGLLAGAQAVLGTARAFGLGSSPQFDLPAAPGHLPDPRTLSVRGLAQISFGQGPLLVTPLQMALVAAAIGNHGIMMRPFLLSEVREPEGRILAAYAQRGSREVLPAWLAALVARDMTGVVDGGTGTAAQIEGIQVAGKTGTAENPHGATHAWFIAFAPAARPSVAVAVLLENAGVGGEIAAPVARQVLDAALRSQSPGGSRP